MVLNLQPPCLSIWRAARFSFNSLIDLECFCPRAPMYGREVLHHFLFFQKVLIIMTTMQTGTVKWFDDGKGFGFITPADGSKDLFAHHSEIKNNGGFRTLAEGANVEFEVKQGPKGLQASNIRQL